MTPAGRGYLSPADHTDAWPYWRLCVRCGASLPARLWVRHVRVCRDEGGES